MSSVIEALKNFDFKSSSVTVAFSGGADSTALLYGLYLLKDELNISLSAMHFNHCLRGDESDRDEQFCRDFCQKYSIDFVSERREVSAFAKENKMSIELAARTLRYDFFKRKAKGVVATAHNSDDNIETVIFRLIRGSSIKGLCGIPERRDIYVRPLLNCQRKEIEEFVKEHNIPFVTDSTNESDLYTRNRLRHHVVPFLREENENLESSFSKTLTLIKEDSQFLSDYSLDEYKKRKKEKGLFVGGMDEMPFSVSSRVAELFLSEETKTGFGDINSVIELIKKGKGKIGVSERRIVVLKNDLLFFEKNEEKEFDVKLEETRYEQKIHNLLLNNLIDCDKIVGKLCIRTRKNGDKITLADRNVTKPLRKWMNEEGIDPILRDKIPVISDDKGVVWVMGAGVSKRVKVGSKTSKVVVITVSEKKGKI